MFTPKLDQTAFFQTPGTPRLAPWGSGAFSVCPSLLAIPMLTYTSRRVTSSAC